MQFSVPAMTNSSSETADANNYPLLRLFTVGQGTSSKTPLLNLVTIEQKWSVNNESSVNDHNGFGYFSAVCYIFGREIHKALGMKVPLGLISNNWGGTPVEHWADPAAFARCNRTDDDSTLYNAMINPYAVGPMALTGFTWYQGACPPPHPDIPRRASYNASPPLPHAPTLKKVRLTRATRRPQTSTRASSHQ